jgi:Protein of unknown function (DUF429)
VPSALPRLVAHADWSVHPRKRWFARAVLQSDGRYAAWEPEPVGPLETFWADLDRAGDGPALAGFDFPIGLPQAYAERAGIEDFVTALPGFGQGGWAMFYAVAETPEEIARGRPFYPHNASRKGAVARRHLLAGLGLREPTELVRRCDRKTAARNAACMLFWTAGANQVGKGAVVGWRDLLGPAVRQRSDLAVWPFHGRLDELLSRHRIVVAETYPGEIYSHLGLELRRHGGKRKQSARQANATHLLRWAAAADVSLDPALRVEMKRGFGASRDGEDRFDAVVGLLGMLNVVLGLRSSGEPDDPVVRRIEGWMLGLQADAPVPDQQNPQAASRSRRRISRLTST